MADLPAVPPVAPGVPDAAQMDLLTVIVRLRQIRDEQRDVDEWPWLLDRVLDCDLPRLERYLTQETLDWMTAQQPL